MLRTPAPNFPGRFPRRWSNTAAQALFALVTAGGLAISDGAWGDVRDEVYRFHRALLEQSENAPAETALRRVCSVDIAPAAHRPGAHTTFAGFDGRTAAIAIFTAGPVLDVRKVIWLRPRFTMYETQRKEASMTPDWGYVFDRNRDGLVDYFAFVIGPTAVAPPDAGPLPDISSGSLTLTTRQFLRFIEILPYRYWEVIDTDFDTRADALLVPARRRDGWVEGAMLMEGLDRSGIASTCCWRSEQGLDIERSCRVTPSGCETADRSMISITRDFPGIEKRMIALMDLVNDAAKRCRLKSGSMPAFPRRY